MRVLLSVILCLFIVVYVRAQESYVLGERELGDHLITNETMVKHAKHHSKHKPKAKIIIKATDPEDVINRVEITSKHPATFKLKKGDIGENKLVVLAIGKKHQELDLHIIAYALHLLKTTEKKFIKNILSSESNDGSGFGSISDESSKSISDESSDNDNESNDGDS